MRISDWSSDVCSSDLNAPSASKQRAPPRQACLRPVLLAVVVLRHCRYACGQYQPRLLRGGEDVDVGRARVRIVQRAHADEGDRRAGAGVMAPQRYPAAGAAHDLLSLAARSEEHTSELQSLMRTSYAVFYLKKKQK